MVENIKVQMIPVAKYGRVIQFDFEKNQSPLFLKKLYHYTNITAELLQLFIVSFPLVYVQNLITGTFNMVGHSRKNEVQLPLNKTSMLNTDI